MKFTVASISGSSSASPTSNGATKEDVAKPKIPRGLRALPAAAASSRVSPGSELGMLRSEASSIDQWWKDPRWKNTTRVYSCKSNQMSIALLPYPFCIEQTSYLNSLLITPDSNGRGLLASFGSGTQ
jgi:hypothetical protein